MPVTREKRIRGYILEDPLTIGKEDAKTLSPPHTDTLVTFFLIRSISNKTRAYEFRWLDQHYRAEDDMAARTAGPNHACLSNLWRMSYSDREDDKKDHSLSQHSWRRPNRQVS